MHQVPINETYNKPTVKSLDLRTKPSYLLGIALCAVRKAISIHNRKSEGSEKGRPRKSLEFSFAVVKDNNEIGYQNTVKAIAVALKESYYFDVSHQSHLRHLHELNLRYKKGERRNLKHDSPENVSYRYTYVNQRLLNLNGSCQPIQPEVFLDESYCHLDHSITKTWSTVGGYCKQSWSKTNDGHLRNLHCV